MGDYIKPTQAYKKLEAAKLLRQSVYIYAAPGYGKTELIHQYFRNKKYIFIPCQQNFCDLSLIPDGYTDAVVIVLTVPTLFSLLLTAEQAVNNSEKQPPKQIFFS